MMIEKPRVLLLQSVAPRVNTNPPLGLAYLGAALEGKGCDVRIIDAAAPYASYSIKDLVRQAQDFAPHLIGLTITVNFVKYSYILLEALSQAKLGALLVAGGPHATILPEEVLQHHAEVVVRDEGEETILELVDCVQGKRELGSIRGVSYKDATGQVVNTSPRPLIANLDSLPFPARHLFVKSDYVRHPEERERFGHLFTSRGCPARCTYCSKLVFGNRLRFRSAESILKELTLVKEEYGISRFRFIDDSFTASKKRVHQLCDLILENGLRLSWVCETRLDWVDEELLRKMQRAGCRSVTYGIESGNPATLKRIRKGFTRERATEAVKVTNRAGLNCSVNFMFGFPWETAEDVRLTTQHIKELQPYVTVFAPGGILIPFPGTEIYDEFQEEYHHDGWWLKAEGKEAEEEVKVRPPLFEAIYFDFMVLERDFFRYSPQVVHEIRKAGDLIGRHNMRFASARVAARLSFLRPLIFLALVSLCKLSQRLYNISPGLERLLMKPFLHAAERYQHLN